MRAKIALMTLIFSSLAFGVENKEVAAELVNDIRVEKDVSRSSFSMGSDFVNLTGEGGSLMGFGFKAGFEYGFTETISAGTNVTFTYQATGKPGAFFYSSISGLIRYTYRGVNFTESTVIKKRDGVVLYKSTPEMVRRSTFFGGFEQLFLNGSANVYPAIGVTLGWSRAVVLWERSLELELRYSMLQANDNPLSLMGVGATFNLDL